MVDTHNQEVGLIGAGHIGLQLCRHLLARGYRVLAFDVAPAACASASDLGASVASSVGEVGARSSHVLLSLPGSEAVEDVVLSEGGLGLTMPPGSLLIDTSSSRPTSTRRIASELSQRGVRMLDAPVSGGVPRARDADLAVMVGGSRQDLEEAVKFLECFAGNIFHVGATGTGHLLKALNNLLSATTLVSASEALLLATRGGIAAHRFIEVINASSGRSNSTEVKFPRYILTREFGDGFAANLMNKDLTIALEASAELDFPLTVGSVVVRMWQEAINHGLSNKDHTEFFAVLEKMTSSHETREWPRR